MEKIEMADMTNTGTASSSSIDAVLLALVELMKTGASPDILEAQRLLLQRVALEGDVIPSRLPAPKNVTEMGGYINLLTEFGQSDLRTEMLASTLGVAGPPKTNLLPTETAVAFVPLPNDRPTGVSQASIPTSISIRSDMLDAFGEMRKTIHIAGCSLPLLTPVRILPRQQPGALAPPDDLLPLLGRTLDIVPATLLSDTANDPVVVARLSGDPMIAWQLTLRELDGGVLVTPQSWATLQCDDVKCTPQTTASLPLLPLTPVMNAGGWYVKTPLEIPTTKLKQGSLTHWINIAGLVVGSTRLGDELSLVYPSSEIAGSTLIGRLHWVWNGTKFVP